MSAFNYEDLKRHVGHNIVCVEYGNGVNVAVECETCNEVVLDYDKHGDINNEYDEVVLRKAEYLINNRDKIIEKVESEGYIVFTGEQIKKELISEYKACKPEDTTLDEWAAPVNLVNLENGVQYIVDGDFSFDPVPVSKSSYVFMDMTDYLNTEEYESFSDAYDKLASHGVNVDIPFIEISIRDKEFYIN